MIVTLTAHPALDRTIDLGAALQVGEVQSALGAREDAGGKGINASRVVHAAGVATRAVLPLAPEDPFAAVLRASDVPVLPVAVTGHVRANIAITSPSGQTTKINLPGTVPTAAEIAALVEAVVGAAEHARWLVLAGSLPPGTADDFYVEVIRAVRARWGAAAPRIAVDTSGAALRAVVATGTPDLIKPNDDELAELVGEDFDDAADLSGAVLAAARRLVPAHAGAALVTLGAAGAVLVTAEGAWSAVPPPIRARSTVGAGDSSLAGYLLADSAGHGPAECLRHAIRCGAAAASLPGTQAPAPTDLPSGDVPVRTLTP
ncbi:1-phosphofructokinase family hexose kinase [Microbacterium invictum]|uniref:1-phosphofructokinase n=1 Tax=Microbacterium invictum TaxID=515415 RepID=A0AA40VM22_9MICO|nr:1-phosphofructokinase family hexose kinase [Microbacterium invictum]MBB4138873.1 1-phosphofructokinase [Microbacterium invictum]